MSRFVPLCKMTQHVKVEDSDEDDLFELIVVVSNNEL